MTPDSDYPFGRHQPYQPGAMADSYDNGYLNAKNAINSGRNPDDLIEEAERAEIESGDPFLKGWVTACVDHKKNAEATALKKKMVQ